MKKLFWLMVIGPLVRMVLTKQPPRWPKRSPSKRGRKAVAA